MKVFIVLVAIGFLAAAQAITDQQKEKLRALGKECQAVTGVSQESIDKVKRGQHVDDPKLKEQALCVLKKTGFANEAGALQIDFIKTKLKENAPEGTDVDALVTRCAVTKSSPEQTAYDTLKCLMQSAS